MRHRHALSLLGQQRPFAKAVNSAFAHPYKKRELVAVTRDFATPPDSVAAAAGVDVSTPLSNADNNACGLR